LLHRRMAEDCARHLDAAARLFAEEGLDFAPVRQAWEALKRMPAPAATVPVPAGAPAAPAPPAMPQPAAGPGRRASVAVMPFWQRRSGMMARSGLGDGLTHDVITRLAKLRSLF